MVDHFVQTFGRRDPLELTGKLHLALVQFIRSKLGTMYDDRLDRALGAKLFYVSLHFARGEKVYQERHSQLNREVEVPALDETIARDMIDKICDGEEEESVVDMLMQGYSITETARKMGVCRQTVYSKRMALQDKLAEHLRR